MSRLTGLIGGAARHGLADEAVTRLLGHDGGAPGGGAKKAKA